MRQTLKHVKIVINHRTPHFVSTESICIYYRLSFQIYIVTQRLVSEENAFKKSKTINIGSKFFYLKKNQVFKD